MSGEFLRTDLHAIFNTAEFASCAVYRAAGGSARNVRVIMNVPDESLALGNVGVHAPQRTCRALVCEYAAVPQRGDELTVPDPARGVDVDYVLNKEAARELSGDVYVFELVPRA